LDDAYDNLDSDGLDTEDTDGDGDPDYVDEDSDDDGVPDATEAFDTDSDGEPNTVPSGNDINNNGIDDAYENGAVGYEDPNGSLNTGAIATNNTDQADDVDFRDTDDDNDGLPTGEDDDGIDTDCDLDGIPDYLDDGPCDLIPDGFSPNGDGTNDLFVIPAVNNAPNFEIEIYNRYGNVVYEYSNKGSLTPKWWDAFSNGRWTLNKDSKKVPVGTYFYIINFNDGNREPVQGWVYVNY
jgi:gliding motility-associated-like protein